MSYISNPNNHQSSSIKGKKQKRASILHHTTPHTTLRPRQLPYASTASTSISYLDSSIYQHQRQRTAESRYLAKCKSYPNHFRAFTPSTSSPGVPYVNGAKKQKPQKVNPRMASVAIHPAISDLQLMRSSAWTKRRVRDLPDGSSWEDSVAARLPWMGWMLKINSIRAPATSADARCAGR